MAKKKPKPFQPAGISPEHIAHREFVLDRGAKVAKMIKKLKASPKLQEKFFKKPESVAAEFDVSLNDEESHVIRLLKDSVDLDNIGERLQLAAVTFFDANCKCGMPGF